jgi:allantoin racemase
VVRVAFAVGAYPPKERKEREDAALRYASSDVDVGIVSVHADPYIHGMTPAEIQLAAGPFIEAFREAERAGYDAVVPLGVLDLGVDGGRCAVDIPVIAPLEAILLIASALGDRFGMIVYDPTFVPWMRAMVARYGMAGRVAGWRATNVSLPDMSAQHDTVVEKVVAGARSLIEDDGAEVILPLGISQCPIHIRPEWLTQQLGVPVVEGIGAPIRLAALLAGLGLTHSRKRWPKSQNFPTTG